ncbi:MAG: diguanylate cyclase [Bacilli bacterium]|nr:diguanylate cyclase [Bacilli bacterium]
MHSIRTKITFITIISIVVAIFVTALVGCVYIANFGHDSVEQSLALLCTTGKNNINYYLKSVEQSVNTVSTFIDHELDEIDDASYNEGFAKHMEEARVFFREASENTNGVLTYYYRIDPSISDQTGEKGFWFTNLDGKGFVEHEVTDISDDHNECIWFYTPKNTGEPVWLSPYVTDNLDAIVISYNVPVYRHNSFVGVVGIEISYHTLGEQIKNIKVLESGFAYIIEDSDGSIIYHPYIDILNMPVEKRPSIPEGFFRDFSSGKNHLTYTFEGVYKHAHLLHLSNNMSIVVCVPQAEINNTWLKIVWQIVIAAAAVIVVIAVTIIFLTRRLTKPLKELTLAAEEINKGNYDVELKSNRNDEIGVLTTTMDKLIDYLGTYIGDLNNLAYSDALTSVKNRSSFDLAMKGLQERIDKNEDVEFAIAMFDCDGLKDINDKYGHDKGNVYLKNSSFLMSKVFSHSDIYRIGGDEFVAILFDEDFQAREELKERFFKLSEEKSNSVEEGWEKINVSIGIASYDKEIDSCAEDVFIHADHLMYENKRERKRKNK